MGEKQQIDAQDILEKYDKENQFRTSIGRWGWVVTFLAVYLTIFHLYTGYFGTLPTQKQGAIHLGTALGIIFLLFPAKKGMHRKQKAVPWYDVISNAPVLGYDTFDIIVSVLGILLVLEATRRTVGLPIVIVASIAILYALFGKYVPTQVLSHSGFSIQRLAPNLWFQESAVF